MEIYIYNMYISKYQNAHKVQDIDTRRMRRLLLHKREIRRLNAEVNEKGYTIVPVKMYFKNNRVKLEIALAKGKKNYDKRNDLKAKTQKREIEKAMKLKNRF